MTSSLNLSALIVRGELYWRGADQAEMEQWIYAGYVAVEGEGKFIMNLSGDGSGGGSGGSGKNGWIYIKDNGAVHPVGRERFFGGAATHHAAYGQGKPGPTVEITGRELTRTWSLLSKPLSAGETTLKLLYSPVRMGWKVGDRIGVSPTRPDSDGTGQTFKIAASR